MKKYVLTVLMSLSLFGIVGNAEAYRPPGTGGVEHEAKKKRVNKSTLKLKQAKQSVKVSEYRVKKAKDKVKQWQKKYDASPNPQTKKKLEDAKKQLVKAEKQLKHSQDELAKVQK